MMEHQADESFKQVVYTKFKSNGKTELVPLKLYIGDPSEYASAENIAALATNQHESLLVNRYELQRVLGQGGFGRTFLTLDRHRFNEPCVVKEFLPQQQGDYETQKSRELFVREAKILNQIDHPQIPKFFACFEEDKKLFLVQEYIKGQTYSHLLHERQQQGGTFSEIEIIKWLKDLLPVLAYLHDRQIVHRDISLDNVMCQDDSHLPMLIDFGIGRSALVQGHSRSEPGSPSVNYPNQQSIVGKIGYAPYEQIWLGQSFPSSDLYSLAVSAVVMLTGSNPQALNNRLFLKGKWQLQTSVSHGLVRILNRMLQDIPDNRYQSAAANLADLEQLSLDSQMRLSHPESTSSITPPNSLPTAIHSQMPAPQVTAAIHSQMPAPQMPAAIHSQMPAVISLTDEFTAQCQKDLIDYVGPIGKFLMQNTITKHSNLSPEVLITLLAEYIPQSLQAEEFRSNLRKYINTRTG